MHKRKDMQHNRPTCNIKPEVDGIISPKRNLRRRRRIHEMRCGSSRCDRVCACRFLAFTLVSFLKEWPSGPFLLQSIAHSFPPRTYCLPRLSLSPPRNIHTPMPSMSTVSLRAHALCTWTNGPVEHNAIASGRELKWRMRNPVGRRGPGRSTLVGDWLS